jgi:hypothetical protein
MVSNAGSACEKLIFIPFELLSKNDQTCLNMSNKIHGNIGGTASISNNGSSISANGSITYNPTPNTHIGIEGNINHDMPKNGSKQTNSNVMITGSIDFL